MRGRKPKPTALRIAEGNPGKRGFNAAEPVLPEGMPDCPDHLEGEARTEWFRVVQPLHAAGILTTVDRAALAAYCQCWGRWVEAETMLKSTPILVKTPSGYVQQNPWLGIANKQMELMGRYMAELGITPASRSRVVAQPPAGPHLIEGDAVADKAVPMTPFEIARRVAFLLASGVADMEAEEDRKRVPLGVWPTAPAGGGAR